MPKLTNLEQRIYNLLVKGYTYQEIAFRQSITTHTVRKYVANVLKKYNCKSTILLVINHYEQIVGPLQEDSKAYQEILNKEKDNK